MSRLPNAKPPGIVRETRLTSTHELFEFPSHFDMLNLIHVPGPKTSAVGNVEDDSMKGVTFGIRESAIKTFEYGNNDPLEEFHFKPIVEPTN